MHNTQDFTKRYHEFIAPGLDGRYITPDHLEIYDRYINDLKGNKERIGASVLGEPIYMYSAGNGPVNVLMWSQMHGNESTTTRALADVLKYLAGHSEFAGNLFDKLSLHIIPVLNPDGARAYTRMNAAGVDLNRDAQDRSQPESAALRLAFDRIGPDYCLNLHDQRTIFSAGKEEKPATVSFLSPSYDAERQINSPRMVSMQVIAAMNAVLQEIIPGQVGRYDDGFNLNCVGDTFMFEGVPTILFESGHYQGDYQRNTTRKCIAIALLSALERISNQSFKTFTTDAYFAIPENRKLFCDLKVSGIKRVSGGRSTMVDLCYMYKEVLKNDRIEFELEFDQMVDPGVLFGHKNLTLDEAVVFDEEKEGAINEFARVLRKRMSF